MNNRQFLLHASWTFHHDMDEQGVNEQELGKPLNASPRMLDTQVNLTEDFLSERCCAFLRFAKFCGNLGLKSSRKTSNRVAYGAKQVVPLSLQNEFVLTRVTCRFLRNGANKFAVSLRERGRINECWICKLSSLGTSALWCNERIKDCLINRMSSVQSSAYICFSRQWFKFFMLDGTLDFGQMNRCLPYWT